MRVSIELSSILSFSKGEVYIFEDYDEKFFPQKQKGQLSFSDMFEYWSKKFKEIGVNYNPDHFDMTKNMGIMFDIKEVK